MTTVLEPGDVDASTIEANLRGWLVVFERFPGARLDHVAGCDRWLRDVPLPLFNGAIGMPTGDDLDAAMSTVLKPFDAAGVPLLWVLPTRDPAILSALEPRGFGAGAGTPGMTIDLAALPRPDVPSGTEIHQIDPIPTLCATP